MTGSNRNTARLKLNKSRGANCGWRGSRSLLLSRRGLRGQELVEFALMIPVLALFVFGVLDVGRIFHALIVLSNAAREGARYGVLHGIDYQDSSLKDTNSDGIWDIIDVVKLEVENLGLNPDKLGIEVNCLDNNPSDIICSSPGRLRVKVTYSFEFILLMVFDGDLNLVRDMEMALL